MLLSKMLQFEMPLLLQKMMLMKRLRFTMRFVPFSRFVVETKAQRWFFTVTHLS